MRQPPIAHHTRSAQFSAPPACRRIQSRSAPFRLWPEDLGPTTDKVYRNNRQYYNLGCAYQRNLAAQVAEPADLVQPRSETPVLASRRSIVIDKYRKGD